MYYKPNCSKRVYTGARWDWGGHMCSKPGTVQVNDKWYCSTHSPAAEEKRKAAQDERWAARRKQFDEEYARKQYDITAGEVCRQLGIADPKELLTLIAKREAP